MARFDYILKDNVYESQKNNLNPDGSSNMTFTKEYRRFNQCFISSATASFNQVQARLDRMGLPRGTSGLMDEWAYLISFLSWLNPKKKDGTTDHLNDNPDRYLWAKHCEYLNFLMKNSYKGKKLPGIWKTHASSVGEIVSVLKSEFQPVVGIWIKNFYPTGSGHVTCACGYSLNEKEELVGLIFNDPAGQLTSKNSYKDMVSGEEVFYSKSIFPKIFQSGRQMLYFELTR